jgi:hypothetical protein
LHYGTWPEACALHRCDNPLCCNPAHLFGGDRAANNADMARKGRANPPRGERVINAKLTEDQVREIKHELTNGTKRGDLARRFNVTHGAIWNIDKGLSWLHVTIP